MTADTIQILLHAPTPAALARARSNANNLLKQSPALQVRILLNADAVAAALDTPDEAADALTLLCPNTLQRIGRQARAPFAVLQEGSVLALARMQGEGWRYIRA
jgi:intracellular sulfur oxidation DsrE/DsrF family protein